MYSQSVKDISNDLFPQSCSADKCSDPEFQYHGRTKPGRRERFSKNWSLTQWEVSVAVRITLKQHAALPQKTRRGAAQDMSFRIEPEERFHGTSQYWQSIMLKYEIKPSELWICTCYKTIWSVSNQILKFKLKVNKCILYLSLFLFDRRNLMRNIFDTTYNET